MAPLRRGGQGCARAGRGEDGSALVELAMALPILLALFTAICSFALTLSSQLTLTQAVGTGGQYLQQARSNEITDPCQGTYNTIVAAAPYLTASNISLTFNLNGTKVTGNTCSGDESDLVEGASVTVSATYPCSLQIYGIQLGSGCQLSAQVTEYEY